MCAKGERQTGSQKRQKPESQEDMRKDATYTPYELCRRKSYVTLAALFMKIIDREVTRFSKLSGASILAARAAQCRLMCSDCRTKYEALQHAIPRKLSTTDRSRRPRVSQGLLIPRLTPGIHPEEGYSSKVEKTQSL